MDQSMEFNLQNSPRAKGELFVAPPEEVLDHNKRPGNEWIAIQEHILNTKYPGRGLLLEYHALDNKMHVTENKSDVTSGAPTIPLDEWLKLNV